MAKITLNSLTGTYKMTEKITAFITAFLICHLCYSQNNSLVIVSSTGQPYYLNLDGALVNAKPQSIMKAFDLKLGKHQIELLDGTRTVFFKDSVEFVNVGKYLNKEFTFALVKNNNKFELQYKALSEPSGPITPPIPEKPVEIAPLIDNSIYGNLYRAKANKPIFFDNYSDSIFSCIVSLNEKDIEYGVKLLNRCNDEERRMRYAIEIVKNNCYTVAQLLKLLNTFNTELERLEIAKPAYLHLTDKKNVALLYPAFKYETVISNYKLFIADQENLVKQKKMKCSVPVDDIIFTGIFNKVKTSGYDNEKIVAAKKEMANVCLSQLQVKQLAGIFTHDREKLECLKCAYPILTDKENANLLVDEFQFDDTRQEYLKFVQQQL